MFFRARSRATSSGEGGVSFFEESVGTSVAFGCRGPLDIGGTWAWAQLEAVSTSNAAAQTATPVRAHLGSARRQGPAKAGGNGWGVGDRRSIEPSIPPLPPLRRARPRLTRCTITLAVYGALHLGSVVLGIAMSHRPAATAGSVVALADAPKLPIDITEAF